MGLVDVDIVQGQNEAESGLEYKSPLNEMLCRSYLNKQKESVHPTNMSPQKSYQRSSYF